MNLYIFMKKVTLRRLSLSELKHYRSVKAKTRDKEQQFYKYHMTVGLNSNLSENILKINSMNLVVFTDASESISSPFNHFHMGGGTFRFRYRFSYSGREMFKHISM